MFFVFLKIIRLLGYYSFIILLVLFIIIVNINYRLLDVIIFESSEKLNKSLYDTYFINRLEDLVVHRNGNFTIQKILSTVGDVTQVIVKLYS